MAKSTAPSLASITKAVKKEMHFKNEYGWGEARVTKAGANNLKLELEVSFAGTHEMEISLVNEMITVVASEDTNLATKWKLLPRTAKNITVAEFLERLSDFNCDFSY